MSIISNHDGKFIILKSPHFSLETSMAAIIAIKGINICTMFIDAVFIIVIKPLVIHRFFTAMNTFFFW